MRFYLFNGKIYRSHNKDTLVKRLFKQKELVKMEHGIKRNKTWKFKKLIVGIKKNNIMGGK